MIWLFSRPLRTLGRAAIIGTVGALLAGVWLIPLVTTFSYTTDMRYEAIGVCPEGTTNCATATYAHYTDYLFPANLFEPRGGWPWQWGGYLLIGIAVVGAVVWLRRSSFVLLAITAVAGLTFYNWEGVHALLGSTPAWNLRLLPFWYLCIHLVMAVGVAELVIGAGWLAAAVARRNWWSAPPERLAVGHPQEIAPDPSGDAISWTAPEGRSTPPSPTGLEEPANPRGLAAPANRLGLDRNGAPPARLNIVFSPMLAASCCISSAVTGKPAALTF